MSSSSPTPTDIHSADEPLVADLATWNRRLGLPPQSRVLRKEIAAGRLKALRLRPSVNAKLFLRAEDVHAWLVAAQGRAVVRRT